MKKAIISLCVVCTAILLSGCGTPGVGAGMSGDEAKDAIAKMPPEQKIRAIANSPMPGPEKEKEFAKIEKETGVKAADVLGKGQAGSPGAGSVNLGGK